MVLMPKIPSGKGKRLIVLHAGNRGEGLIDRCDLVFLAKAKDGDYHQEMNGPNKVKVSVDFEILIVFSTSFLIFETVGSIFLLYML
jgi:hypothetical protein